MESELSGIFQVKLVTKNIERGSPGTQFIHMRVNVTIRIVRNSTSHIFLKEYVHLRICNTFAILSIASQLNAGSLK